MGSIRRRGTRYQVRYYRDGQRFEEACHSDKKADALALLKLREGDIVRGVPVTPVAGRLQFAEAAQDVLNDYAANGKRSLDDVRARLRRLTAAFGARRMTTLTTADFTAYAARRRGEGAANATINRELAAARRAFTLAHQGGKLQHVPHIALLREHNVRSGFVEDDAFARLVGHLPAAVQPVARFGFITGWRLSEVLGLSWRQVDFATGRATRFPTGPGARAGACRRSGGCGSGRSASGRWHARTAT